MSVVAIQASKVKASGAEGQGWRVEGGWAGGGGRRREACQVSVVPIQASTGTGVGG